MNLVFRFRVFRCLEKKNSQLVSFPPPPPSFTPLLGMLDRADFSLSSLFQIISCFTKVDIYREKTGRKKTLSRSRNLLYLLLQLEDTQTNVVSPFLPSLHCTFYRPPSPSHPQRFIMFLLASFFPPFPIQEKKNPACRFYARYVLESQKKNQFQFRVVKRINKPTLVSVLR